MDCVSAPSPEGEIQVADALSSLTEGLDNIDGRLASIERSIAAAQVRIDEMSKQHLDSIARSTKGGDETIRLSVSSIFLTIAISFIILGITTLLDSMAPGTRLLYGLFYIIIGLSLHLGSSRIIDWTWGETKR